MQGGSEVMIDKNQVNRLIQEAYNNSNKNELPNVRDVFKIYCNDGSYYTWICTNIKRTDSQLFFEGYSNKHSIDANNRFYLFDEKYLTDMKDCYIEYCTCNRRTFSANKFRKLEFDNIGIISFYRMSDLIRFMNRIDADKYDAHKNDFFKRGGVYTTHYGKKFICLYAMYLSKMIYLKGYIVDDGYTISSEYYRLEFDDKHQQIKKWIYHGRYNYNTTAYLRDCMKNSIYPRMNINGMNENINFL